MGGKASLLLVMGFSFILAFISFNLNRYATQAVTNMSMYNESSASHNLAVTGANVALAKLYQDTTFRGSYTKNFDLVPGIKIKGQFTYSVEDVGFDKIRLRSVSTYPLLVGSLNDTVEVYFGRSTLNSFSVLAWMTDFEGNVFWVTGDTVWGRVHSNGNLHVAGSPVFLEKVTTAKGFDPRPGRGTNRAQFMEGYETGIASIDFPVDLSDLIGASTPPGGRHYAGSPWITLNPGTAANDDGYVLVRDTEFGAVVDSISLSDPAFSEKVILSDGNANVKGTLDGSLTIMSMVDVVIQNDIVYEKNPMVDPSADDVLGLVSYDDVVVADNAALNPDCRIDASIFTYTGSFEAANYAGRGLDGLLKVFGSIVQKERGAVGQYSGTHLSSGFYKRYRYDERLADTNFRPPHYPGFYTKALVIANWWESYRVNIMKD